MYSVCAVWKECLLRGHPGDDTDLSMSVPLLHLSWLLHSGLSLPPFLWMGPCHEWETNYYCSGVMFFYFTLDICYLFGLEFGKCFHSLWWSDLEGIMRWSWQPASGSQQWHRGGSPECGVQTSTLLWMFWLQVPRQGLCSFSSKILSRVEWNI